MSTTLNQFTMLIVSGLSGSGKTVALNALEDMGYYCIDNIPAVLLPELASVMSAPSGTGEQQRVAVGLDSRNQQFLEGLPDILQSLQSSGVDYRIIFLEAEEKVLIKRFSETRRKHPLTDRQTPLVDGIRKESELIQPLIEHAVRRIDTSRRTPHELRRLIRDVAGVEGFAGPVLFFESFGYKHGTPQDADFVFDVRCLPNPYWQEPLKNLTGLDQEVVDFLSKEHSVTEMFTQIQQLLSRWLPNFQAEHRSYITVAIGCTGGQHRSVYMIEKLKDHFKKEQIQVQISHRELPV
ncbi:MAG: UPF0042 nucleotide-binding protein [Parasphingorhabdus sp.]|jgi:UPF0042 nucleotide-binding protein